MTSKIGPDAAGNVHKARETGAADPGVGVDRTSAPVRPQVRAVGLGFYSADWAMFVGRARRETQPADP